MKLFSLHFDYIGTNTKGEETAGVFDMLLRAETKELALDQARRRLDELDEKKEFLSDVRNLSIDLNWYFEIGDVTRPVVVSYTTLDVPINTIMAVPCGEDLTGSGVQAHEWDVPDYVPSGALAGVEGVTSSLFWERKSDTPAPESPSGARFGVGKEAGVKRSRRALPSRALRH